MLKRLFILALLIPLSGCGDDSVNNKKNKKQRDNNQLLLNSSAFVSACSAGRMDTAFAKTLNGLYALTGTEPATEGCIPLAGRMAKLNKLKLNPTGLTNISFLAEFTNLTSLDISGNKVTSLDPIKGLGALTELNASDNQIKDLNPVSNNKKLTKLYIANNADIDPKTLQALPKNMDELDLSGIKLGKVTALPVLNVNLLRIKNNGLQDLKGLSVTFGNGPGTLDVGGNDISDFSPLTSISSLNTILAIGTKAEAKGCPALKACTWR